MMASPVRTAHLAVVPTSQQHREEARIERLAGLDEFATDAERAYELLALLPKSHESRKVIDYRFHLALRLISRAGTRARAAERELRGLTGEGA